MRGNSFRLTVVVLLFFVASVIPITSSTKSVQAMSSFATEGPTLYLDATWSGTNVTGYTVVVRARVFNLTDNLVPDPDWWFYQIPLGNLWSLRLNFTWDPAILQYVSHTKTMPVETYPGGVLHTPISIITEQWDAGAGWYHLSASSSAGATTFNNPSASNTIVEVTFNVIGTGWSPLNYKPYPQTDLADDGMLPIGVGYFGTNLYIDVVNGLAKRPGDTDGDHNVGQDDLIASAAAWQAYNPNADFDSDGDVDCNDLYIQAQNYGT